MANSPFGKFKFDKTYEVHETSVTHRGNKLRLSIHVDDEFTLDDALPIATEFWKQRAKWFKTARETASPSLLDMLNDRIDNDDRLKTITKTAFSKSLTVPDSIRLEIDADQKWFELSYFSDLYGEHAISVSINLTHNSIDADIANLY